MMSVGTPNTRPLLEAMGATDIMQEWERRKVRTAWWMAGLVEALAPRSGCQFLMVR